MLIVLLFALSLLVRSIVILHVCLLIIQSLYENGMNGILADEMV